MELLTRPVPKFIQDAGKAFHKVGDAIAGQNGIFGKNTWAKVGLRTARHARRW